jgi:hypothetical protein
MNNPFKAVGGAVSGMFTSADQCDFFNPTMLKVGAVIVTPIVAPVAFIAAFFQKSDKKK